MRPFLLVWNVYQAKWPAPTILAYLDTRPEIRNYYTPFLGSILLVAAQNATPSSLATLMRNRFPELLFVVLPADQWSTDGWMPKIFWELLQEPKSSGRWDDVPQTSFLKTLEAASTTTSEGTLGDIIKRMSKKSSGEDK